MHSIIQLWIYAVDGIGRTDGRTGRSVSRKGSYERGLFCFVFDTGLFGPFGDSDEDVPSVRPFPREVYYKKGKREVRCRGRFFFLESDDDDDDGAVS